MELIVHCKTQARAASQIVASILECMFTQVMRSRHALNDMYDNSLVDSSHSDSLADNVRRAPDYVASVLEKVMNTCGWLYASQMIEL
jgi:hypothetical protein